MIDLMCKTFKSREESKVQGRTFDPSLHSGSAGMFGHVQILMHLNPNSSQCLFKTLKGIIVHISSRIS